MIRIDDRSQCCGCSACQAVCPHGAITMKPDRLGFMYPEVDHDLCVDCGLCENVCSFKPQGSFVKPAAYAVRHKDDREVAGSTSGAVFVSLSDHILEKGGVVYGAAFDEGFRVMHKRAVTSDARDEMRRSKYVQSDMGDVFRQVRKDLKDGMTVLFSGTPCQTAGLRSYIGPMLSQNLYLVDIVCHGVPSPKVWEAYLDWQEKKHGSEVLKVDFRDKTYGWRSHKEAFVFSDGKVTDTSYTYLFYEHLTLRESCGNCHFASLGRPSDLTLADYWRKDKAVPDFASDGKGCSLILCSSVKGRELLSAVDDCLYVSETVLADCIQPNMKAPSRLHPEREAFERDFAERGLEYVMRRYGDLGWRYAVRASCKRVYQSVRQTARKILGRR